MTSVTPVNLGNPGEFTILELAELVLELTGSKSPLAPPAAAARRSDQASARHRARPSEARLATDNSAARRVL